MLSLIEAVVQDAFFVKPALLEGIPTPRPTFE